MATIGVLVGSLSRQAYSQKVADYLVKNQTTAKWVQLNYDLLPLYNPDCEEASVLEWQVFRSVVDQMDALLLITPEYNFSIPGGLKNALDVLSVPIPKSHIANKPVLVVTDSSGDRGGANANAHIQQLLRYMGMNVMNDFITIGHVQTVFNRQGQLIDHEVGDQLTQAMARFTKRMSLL
ncbi:MULTISPECIES: NADPH-dependent FMN reductase [Lactobacillaceae]|uniref:NADPH-dependent FMN reductase n=1 Tax=Lactobacillaceae TaxID=33958 RepID=UPI001456B334|nr:NADPH-dependent FMN reductase [Lactobacillus sp. HBUAS51381]NLR08990.1 NAD(P)H-dependent oxidoreductase [Lactobacillus sp. HBUAS51381]